MPLYATKEIVLWLSREVSMKTSYSAWAFIAIIIAVGLAMASPVVTTSLLAGYI